MLYDSLTQFPICGLYQSSILKKTRRFGGRFYFFLQLKENLTWRTP